MGWDSATGVVQHAHRSLCAFAGYPPGLEIRRDRPLKQWYVERGREQPPSKICADDLFRLWQVYLDNLDMLEIVD